MSRYKIRPVSVGALARGSDYRVTDLGESPQGFTKLVEKELGVSLDADAGETRWTQLHELSHVKHSLYTPEKLRRYAQSKLGVDLPIGSILAAEDARINELLVRAVPDAHEGFKLREAGPLRLDVSGYVASHASPEPIVRKIRDAVAPTVEPGMLARVDAFLARLATMPTRELSVLRCTLPLARIIAGATKDSGGGSEGSGEGSDASGKGEPKPGDGEDDGSGEGDGPDGDAGDEDGGSEGDAEDRAMLGKPDRKPGKPGRTCAHASGKHGKGESGDSNDWIIPEVVEPPLTEVASCEANHAVTTAETGTSLRWSHLYRLQTDGLVFRRLKRRPGAIQRGTVLIDGSGSMTLTNEAIDGLIGILPYATVAMYSGRRWTKPESAHIVVLARNGRRVARLHDCPRGHGNMCDGPALLWLSRQPGPRLWLCDGYVTVSGDANSARANEEASAIMSAAGIVQVSGSGDNMRATRTLRLRYEDMGGIDLVAFARVMRDLERGIMGD